MCRGGFCEGAIWSLADIRIVIHQRIMDGIVLITLGALNAFLALNLGTCTQGSADELYGGGWLTLFLYIVGAALFVAKPPRRWFHLAIIPSVAIAVWHSIFAVHFALGYWMEGMSACYALKGGFTSQDAGEWMDGREPLLTVLWLLVSSVFWVGINCGIFRGYRKSVH